MGKRGPRPKLPEVDRLDGNPSRRVMVDSGIEALGDVFVPEHLADDAQACIEVIKRSMPPKIYSALDSFVLAAFAAAWAVHKRAAHEMNNPEFEWVVVSAQGTKQPSPWIKIANQQAALLASLGDRLGLNPKARAALHVESAAKAVSKFDGLIGQTGLSPSSNASPSRPAKGRAAGLN
jgi:phage terminase small subunit